MNCVIDRGNTKTKIYLFENDLQIDMFSFFNEDEILIKQKMDSLNFSNGIISSSSDIPEFILKKHFLVLSNNTAIPISLNYATPNTLGTDRIALAVGAFSLYPNKNCLIISAGTCITIDVLDQNGTYQGGIISPGLTIRLQSLHTFTENLPLLKHSDLKQFPLIGKSTQESMESGIYNGAFAEINQLIDQFKAIYQDLTVIITGGDVNLFDLNIKNKIFAQQNLQALGLNRILLYNAK